MAFVTTISQGGSFATTVTQGGSTWTLDQISAPATFTASIATLGPKGDKGDKGDQGDPGQTGPQGPTGPAGEAATVEVGTVTTLDPGDPVTVVNSGTEAAAVLDFGIPQGDKGDKGDTGDTGPQGPQGIPGVISATAPITYNAGTQTVGFDTTWNPFNQTLNTGDQVEFASVQVDGPSNAARGLFYNGIYATNSSASVGVILSETGVNIFGGADLRFPDSSVQTTAYLGGDLKAANNLSDLANAGTARSNLGLGTMATATASDYLAKSGNLAGLADLSASRSNLGLGTMATEAAANYAAKASANTFTAGQVIETTSTGAALRVTQLGTGEALRVEDSANPDASPFVITADGSCGVGTPSPANKLHINGGLTVATGSVTGNYLGIISTLSGGTTFNNGPTNTANLLTLNNAGTGASLRVNDEASDTTPFIVDAGGNVGVKTAAPGTDFEVNGNAKFTTAEIVTAPAAGDSSAKIPTTAWVQAEVPAASTTVAGKVELATEAEAISGTDTARAVSAFSNKAALLNYSRLSVGAAAWVAGTSGTGAGSGQNFNQKQVSAPTTAVGYGTLYYSFLMRNQGGAYNGVIEWNKRNEFTFLISKGTSNTDANTVGRVVIGKPSFSAVAGDPTNRAVGIYWTGGAAGVVSLIVHDGTTLTTVATSRATQSTFYAGYKIISYGNGQVDLLENGTLVATTNAGPSTAGGGNSATVEAQNLAIITGTPMQVVLGNLTADFGN